MIIGEDAVAIMLGTVFPDSKKHILNFMRVPTKKVDSLYMNSPLLLDTLTIGGAVQH
ncbi:hypothetical protein SRABI84_03601 [Peribacillus simplex]|nr:hypothetical protein SRABI84_03601 [Peribacillus simplex]